MYSISMPAACPWRAHTRPTEHINAGHSRALRCSAFIRRTASCAMPSDGMLTSRHSSTCRQQARCKTFRRSVTRSTRPHRHPAWQPTSCSRKLGTASQIVLCRPPLPSHALWRSAGSARNRGMSTRPSRQRASVDGMPCSGPPPCPLLWGLPPPGRRQRQRIT